MIYATSQASACKWHEAPVNSYLTGASPILFEVALAHGRCVGLLAPLAGDVHGSPPSDVVKPVDERALPAEALIVRSRDVSELVIDDDPNSRAEVDFWALVIRNDPG